MRAFLIIALTCASVWRPTLSAQATMIPEVVDSLDGSQRDMAGPRDVTLSAPGDLIAQNARVVFAQGRRTLHHEVESRERMFLEEDKTFATPLAAVELDENLKVMFALAEDLNTKIPDPNDPTTTIVTPGHLRVYDVLTPSTPQKVFTFPPPPTDPLVEIEPIRAVDIRVIPEDSRLLLLHNTTGPVLTPTKTRLTVYRYGFEAGSFFMVEEGHVDLAEQNPALEAEECVHDPSQQRRLIRGLQRAFVQVDDSPFVRRAFLIATIDQPRAGVPTKGAKAIIAVNLATWNATTMEPDYSAPTFYSGPNQVFDDYPCASGTPTGSPSMWAPHDITLIEDGSNWFLVAVGGEEFQAKSFRITSFDTAGFQYYIHKDFGSGGSETDLHVVQAVGTQLTILARNRQISTNYHLETVSNDVFESYGEGPARDTVLMSEGLVVPEPKIWSATVGGGVDYRFKITGAAPPLGPAERRYAPGDNDSAVYIPDYDSVYLSTFNGGVVRYDVLFDAVPDYDSYTPAIDLAPAPQVLKAIEHIVAAKLPDPLNPWHLFGSTAQGGFFQWRVNPSPRTRRSWATSTNRSLIRPALLKVGRSQPRAAGTDSTSSTASTR